MKEKPVSPSYTLPTLCIHQIDKSTIQQHRSKQAANYQIPWSLLWLLKTRTAILIMTCHSKSNQMSLFMPKIQTAQLSQILDMQKSSWSLNGSKRMIHSVSHMNRWLVRGIGRKRWRCSYVITRWLWTLLAKSQATAQLSSEPNTAHVYSLYSL